MIRKSFIASVVLMALVLSSCGTARRAGKDLGIVASFPVLIPYGGFTDGFTTAQEVTEGLDGGAATQIVVMPFTVGYGLLKHAFYTVVHAVDFFVFPVYGAAELHPYGPEIEPLDYYTGTWFDSDNKAGTDAESGEVVGN